MTPTQREENQSTMGSRERDDREHEEQCLLAPATSISRSDRFANATYLSQYIPELDPGNARAKTFRTKMAKRSTMLKLQMITAFSVVLISSAILLWAILSYPPDERGVGTFLFGHCSTTSTVNTAVHALINIISSLFLGAGNYCMQILIAPSREEINSAHRKCRVLEVGVPSIKNLRYIGWYRTAAWLVIGLIATSLHIFWNSSVFTSLPIVAIPRAMVTSDFRTSFDNWTVNDPLPKYSWWQPPSDQDEAELSISLIYNLQDQVVNFTRLDKRACMQSFLNQLESTRSVVVVSSNVTSMHNNGSSLLDGWITPWENWWGWSNGWICWAHQPDPQVQKYCTMEWAETFLDNWSVGRAIPMAVDYCLVSEGANNKERCGLHYSTHVLGIVCICTLLESLMIVWTWIQYRISSRNPDNKKAKRTMVTMGDAIHSFLEIPIADGLNLMNPHISEGHIRVCNTTWSPQPRVSWFKAVSNRAWAVSVLLFAGGIAVCSYFVVSSYNFLVHLGVDNKSLWKQGFNLHPAMTATGLGPFTETMNRTKTGAMLANILVANSPQVLVSFLYIFYNNILTRQLVADEWVRFLQPDGKKVLRVSSPEGMQRSSYFLSLPLKYSIALMILSITLHWLVSQSIFLVQTSVFSPGKDGQRLPYFDDSSRGYSIFASTLAIALALTLVILLIIHSGVRRYDNIPSDFQRMGFNSRALEAVCQRPDGDEDARFFPIRIGVISGVGNSSSRIVFSTDIHLEMPQENQHYLQPVFVHRTGNKSGIMVVVQNLMIASRSCTINAREKFHSVMRKEKKPPRRSSDDQSQSNNNTELLSLPSQRSSCTISRE